MGFSFEYWRPQATVDIVALRIGESSTSVLLIRRRKDPYKGYWALPGGFIDADDDNLSMAAERELREEVGLVDVELTQVGAWGSKGRDPRDWTVTVVFGCSLAVGDGRLSCIRGADDATEAAWFDIGELPPLAFDHEKVIPPAAETILQGRHAVGHCTP